MLDGVRRGEDVYLRTFIIMGENIVIIVVLLLMGVGKGERGGVILVTDGIKVVRGVNFWQGRTCTLRHGFSVQEIVR